ncbi:MAG TPA: UrcA family protein [Steroidobacteraceae bacterium]|nr:UrcA family protein [Steroidobacteraceae bacterium]
MNALARNTLLAVCLLTGSLGVAHAASWDEVPSRKVSYSDLDLSTAAGTRALYSRITAAARMVCPEENNADLAGVVRARTCRREAIERAVASVNSPQLAALAATHAHRG